MKGHRKVRCEQQQRSIDQALGHPTTSGLFFSLIPSFLPSFLVSNAARLFSNPLLIVCGPSSSRAPNRSSPRWCLILDGTIDPRTSQNIRPVSSTDRIVTHTTTPWFAQSHSFDHETHRILKVSRKTSTVDIPRPSRDRHVDQGQILSGNLHGAAIHLHRIIRWQSLQ